MLSDGIKTKYSFSISQKCTSRVQMLSRLIGYMKSHGAWLDTNRAVASWVLKENGFQVPDHE